MKKNIYAVYKGDTFITMGTAKEIAEKLGIKTKTIYWYMSNAGKRRIKENSLIIIKVDDE